MAIRALTFDYGGTLDGAASHWLDRFVALYAELAVALPFERVRSAFYAADAAAYADRSVADMGLRALMDLHVSVQLRELGIADGRLHEQLVERFVERSHQALAASARVLERLKESYRLAVISNFYGNLEHVLRETGCVRLLDAIVDSNRLGVSKPDPAIFTHAVAALGSTPGETLHVGDSYERDVLAARAAGLRAIWVVPPSQRGAGGERRICSLDELLPLLEEL